MHCSEVYADSRNLGYQGRVLPRAKSQGILFWGRRRRKGDPTAHRFLVSANLRASSSLGYSRIPRASEGKARWMDSVKVGGGVCHWKI